MTDSVATILMTGLSDCNYDGNASTGPRPGLLPARLICRSVHTWNPSRRIVVTSFELFSALIGEGLTGKSDGEDLIGKDLTLAVDRQAMAATAVCAFQM